MQERIGFCQRDRAWLVHHHMFAGQQRGTGQRVVARVSGGNDNQLDCCVGEGVLRRGKHAHLRPVLPDSLRLARTNDRKLQTGHALNQWRMEYAPGVAIADERDANSIHLAILVPNFANSALTTVQTPTRKSKAAPKLHALARRMILDHFIDPPWPTTNNKEPT